MRRIDDCSNVAIRDFRNNFDMAFKPKEGIDDLKSQVGFSKIYLIFHYKFV